ncbi:MAG TPA: nuclear transport factor 2 family protein [Bacteroidetes bacterium]|nr:nuclear transport factor 2 family protein [Bacteroidota bacterium]
MKKHIYFVVLSFVFFTQSVNAQNNTEIQILTQKLHDFMAGASVNDEQIHDDFWAEDLIYTSSSGLRFGKQQIMDGFKNQEESDPAAPSTTYTADEIIIQVYDDVAVVAFKMTGVTNAPEGDDITYYLNSGTFLKRNEKWKVVNWQATRIPNQ